MPILNPSLYGLVRPLFQPLDRHLAVTAILEGGAPAAIDADDPSQAGAAFTWTGCRFFLAGSPQQAAFNEEVRTLLAETIAPQALASGLDRAGWMRVIIWVVGVLPGAVLVVGGVVAVRRRRAG